MVTFFFMAQGRIWWCNGMTNTSSRVMVKASLIMASRLLRSISVFMASTKASNLALLTRE